MRTGEVPECESVYFTGRAVQRMFEKQISKDVAIDVIGRGELIAEYPDDKPLPSYLKLGFADTRAIHIVYAVDDESKICHIITVYPPDKTLWHDDFRTRRRA